MEIEQARAIALAMPDAEEHTHFHKLGFRLKAKKPGGKPRKMFLTIGLEEQMAVLFLKQDQQADLHARHPSVFFPVPNKWGEKGATFVHLANANKKLFEQAIAISYANAVGIK